jgi:hypothetical protein
MVCLKSTIRQKKGMRTLGRPRCRLEDRIRMGLSETGCGGGGIQLPQDRDQGRARVSTVINLYVVAPRR